MVCGMTHQRDCRGKEIAVSLHRRKDIITHEPIKKMKRIAFIILLQ